MHAPALSLPHRRPLVLLSLALAASFLASAVVAADAKPADKAAPDVSILTSDTELEVTNRGTKPWPEMEIYLNEVPEGFKYRGPAPAIGTKVLLPLVRFVDKQGLRFDPAKRSVVKIWIGGGGRDFQLFNVR